MALRVSCFLLKMKPPPLGLTRKEWYRKRSNPFGRKPWKNRKSVSDGTMDIEPRLTQATSAVGDMEILSPWEATKTAPPSSISSAAGDDAQQQASSHHQQEDYFAKRRRMPWDRIGEDLDHLVPGSSRSLSAPPEHAFKDEDEGGQTFPAVFAEREGDDVARGGGGDVALHRQDEMNPAALTTLPIGKQLNFDVLNVTSNRDPTTGAPSDVPVAFQSLKRTRKEVAESIVLPRHINQLYHRIMGWTDEAVQVDVNHPLVTDAAVKEDPALPQRRFAAMKEKMQYGVLLEDYEKDKFAIEHQLEIAGEKFERKFLQWEGMRILDNDAPHAFKEVTDNKGSIILETSNRFKVPKVNHDPCPGCGATLQDKDEANFGFVQRGQVEKYIQDEVSATQARTEYADRMAELQAHWEQHGRRVGEEWLDFMTQEEFDAIYRYKPKPFLCHRCHALENLGTEGRRKVMSAPDFTEQLRTLKEKAAVFVLVIDITDFPGSMVYDLPGLISMNNKVIIAVNKCDCVRMRSFRYKGKDVALTKRMTTERYIRTWVMEIATQFGIPRHQIVDIVPISAKRGWNVDKLLSVIEDTSNLNLQRPAAPLKTYFVGVANVGKSSVINAISHHLYVPQPPHPQSTKVYYTVTDKQGKESVRWRWYTPPNANRAEMIDIPAHHDKKASKLLTVSSLPGTTVAANAVKISLGHKGDDGEASTFFYDTPGLFPHWHQSSPLTLYQMRRTLIRKYRNPECYVLLPGHTLFLGGLAAIDVVKGSSDGILMLVYTSSKVKNAIVNTEKSDEFWAENLGSALDPPGSIEQLGNLRLTISKTYLFECYGKHRLRPKADVYVCGLGWVSFCVGTPSDVLLRVRTLPGVVHGVREPLRPKDLRGWNRWPKLASRFTNKKPVESLDKVIRLTAKEVVPGEEPMKLIARERHPKHASASAAPFTDVLAELERHGKL